MSPPTYGPPTYAGWLFSCLHFFYDAQNKPAVVVFNGTPYSNLPHEGESARQRIRNGFEKPHGVKCWSVGNENYGFWEIGAKGSEEWARLVTESAKMMGDEVIDQWVQDMPTCRVVGEHGKADVDCLDIVSARRSHDGAVAIALVNKHISEARELTLTPASADKPVLHTLCGTGPAMPEPKSSMKD